MTDKLHALEVKAKKVAKKPSFMQRNLKKKKLARVRKGWKKPRGLHNKLRRKRKGIGSWVQTGYKMPRAVRGMQRSGLIPVVVATLAELAKLKPEEHTAIIQASAGKKRKIELLNEAIAKKITVANIKDPTSYIKNIEEAMKKKKEDKKSAVKKKEETKKEVEKKAKGAEEKKEETKSIEELADEGKEKKKELDKILTKKGQQM